MNKAKPKLIIIAGANGSGKTTFAVPYVKELGFQFLNADEIAKKLEEDGVENAMIGAGRIFFARLNENLQNHKNFVVETTLSGSYINKVAAKAKSRGYEVQIIYIFLDNPELCVERVKSRVVKGGHDVPKADIIRRFYRSKANFWNNFVKLTDTSWTLFYNGEAGYQKVAIGLASTYKIDHPILFNLFKKDL
ncbi:MAG: zeta toxin family protein [Bacteroidota bacterium]